MPGGPSGDRARPQGLESRARPRRAATHPAHVDTHELNQDHGDVAHLRLARLERISDEAAVRAVELTSPARRVRLGVAALIRAEIEDGAFGWAARTWNADCLRSLWMMLTAFSGGFGRE